jgi:hypothetical protein
MSSTAPPTLRRTPLYDRHVAAGAKLVDFAGWEMPVQYEGVIQEHIAVREACGIFDVSHMGEIETSGPGALQLLQRLLSNDVAKIALGGNGGGGGGAQYSVLCREDGGVLDDLFTYRLDVDRYLTISNASNHEQDLAWFRAHALDVPDVEVRDRIDDWAMLAVQGPRAREIVQAISDAPLPARMRAETRRLAGAEAIVCGTGYTGEDGVELLCAAEDAPALWDEIVRRGATPAGTRCAWRSAFTSTATTSASIAGRSKRGSGGAARRTPASSAPRPCARSASAGRVGPQKKGSSRSRSKGRGSRDRATLCSAAARSPAARSRRACRPASASPTCPSSGPPPAPL